MRHLPGTARKRGGREGGSGAGPGIHCCSVADGKQRCQMRDSERQATHQRSMIIRDQGAPLQVAVWVKNWLEGLKVMELMLAVRSCRKMLVLSSRSPEVVFVRLEKATLY